MLHAELRNFLHDDNWPSDTHVYQKPHEFNFATRQNGSNSTVSPRWELLTAKITSARSVCVIKLPLYLIYLLPGHVASSMQRPSTPTRQAQRRDNQNSQSLSLSHVLPSTKYYHKSNLIRIEQRQPASTTVNE